MSRLFRLFAALEFTLRNMEPWESIKLFRDWYKVVPLDFLSYTRVPSLIGMYDRHDAAVYHLRSGLQVKMRPIYRDTYIAREVWGGDYLPKGLSRRLLPGTVIDIGAHIGIFALFVLSSRPATTYVGYEPDPRNYGLLTNNLDINKLRDRAHLYQEAVAGEGGRRVLFRSRSCTGNNTIAYALAEDSDAMEVDAVTLDDCFRRDNIRSCSLLKMDIEGAEYEVLMSSPDETLLRINMIAMECHRVQSWSESFNKAIDRLRSCGFLTEYKPTTSERGMLYAFRPAHRETGPNGR